MINVTDQPQTIYKNTFAAMAETIPFRLGEDIFVLHQ
jgi:hypothetical protein